MFIFEVNKSEYILSPMQSVNIILDARLLFMPVKMIRNKTRDQSPIPKAKNVAEFD